LANKLDVDVFLTLTFKLDTFEPENSMELLQIYRTELHTPYTKIIACGFSENKLKHTFQNDLDSLFTVCGYDEHVSDYLVRISKMMGITERQSSDEENDAVNISLSGWTIG